MAFREISATPHLADAPKHQVPHFNLPMALFIHTDPSCLSVSLLKWSRAERALFKGSRRWCNAGVLWRLGSTEWDILRNGAVRSVLRGRSAVILSTYRVIDEGLQISRGPDGRQRCNDSPVNPFNVKSTGPERVHFISVLFSFSQTLPSHFLFSLPMYF